MHLKLRVAINLKCTRGKIRNYFVQFQCWPDIVLIWLACEDSILTGTVIEGDVGDVGPRHQHATRSTVVVEVAGTRS